MKYGLSLLFVLLLSFGGANGWAQTLLVSDVDDTIKLAHVHSYKDMVYYAFDDTSRFMGMSDLYQLIAQDNPDLDIVYLSRAPTWIMQKRHKDFLRKGSFPQGLYIGRSEQSKDQHKITALREVIEELKPKKVILIGDNGEADPIVYRQIAKEFRSLGIEFFQFIRVVYSNSWWSPATPLAEEQTGFVTPIEISLELERQGLMSKSSLQRLLVTRGPDLSNRKLKEKNGEYAFPYFVDCRDFRWKWDDRSAEFSELVTIKDRIVKRCGLQP